MSSAINEQVKNELKSVQDDCETKYNNFREMLDRNKHKITPGLHKIFTEMKDTYGVNVFMAYLAYHAYPQWKEGQVEVFLDDNAKHYDGCNAYEACGKDDELYDKVMRYMDYFCTMVDKQGEYMSPLLEYVLGLKLQ